jgi:predicted nucleic acid-binding protein
MRGVLLTLLHVQRELLSQKQILRDERAMRPHGRRDKLRQVVDERQGCAGSNSRAGPSHDRRAYARVRHFFREAATQGIPLFLSAVTIGELRQGVEAVRHRGDRVPATRLARWLATVTRDYADAILAFDEEIAQIWGRLRVPSRSSRNWRRENSCGRHRPLDTASFASIAASARLIGVGKAAAAAASHSRRCRAQASPPRPGETRIPDPRADRVAEVGHRGFQPFDQRDAFAAVLAGTSNTQIAAP